MQLIFKRRINAGLRFQFGYTFSKSKDNRSWDPSLSTVSTGSVQSASSTPFDLRERNLNYTWSDFDRRHVLQGTYTYELPFGKGRKFLSGAPSIVDHIIAGWQIAGTVIWMSGRPFTVCSGINTVSNNPAFDNPTAVITSTIFGRINDSVTNNARRIQLSGKLSF
ncbi:MAG TPA: hypothetical protein VJW17_10430 [Pyrinomonadaceae bacterium]|nr:hypothetical protein [Pyrinomonadaceae bacterium]